MTREEGLDWLYRLRSEIYVYMPKEWLIPMNNALDMAISTLSAEDNTMEWKAIYERVEVGGGIIVRLSCFECSKCKKQAEHRYDFCPRCGRKAVRE